MKQLIKLISNDLKASFNIRKGIVYTAKDDLLLPNTSPFAIEKMTY